MAFGQNGKSAFFLQVKMHSQNLIFVSDCCVAYCITVGTLMPFLESANF